MDRQHHRNALISGATGGIGRAIAMQLARDGYDIGFLYKSDIEGADALSTEIKALEREACSFKCDISDYAETRKAVDAIEAQLGPFDLVISNAGIVRDSALVMMEPGAWDEVIGTNLNGVYGLCKAVIFGMMKRKSGCIINISSISGVFGNASQSNYSASKAGIIGFSNALAKEVAGYGIRVNVIAPGFIRTQMTDQLDKKVMDKMIKDNIPLKRIGEPEEVAHLVSFLASENAAYINGQVIRIDGGMIL